MCWRDKVATMNDIDTARDQLMIAIAEYMLYPHPPKDYSLIQAKNRLKEMLP